jgi:hypothetical protein
MAKKQTVDRAAGGSPKLVHSHGEQLLDMAKREKLRGSYFTRLVRLTYITRAILDGHLTAEKLLHHSQLPLSWRE